MSTTQRFEEQKAGTILERSVYGAVYLYCYTVVYLLRLILLYSGVSTTTACGHHILDTRRKDTRQCQFSQKNRKYTQTLHGNKKCTENRDVACTAGGGMRARGGRKTGSMIRRGHGRGGGKYLLKAHSAVIVCSCSVLPFSDSMAFCKHQDSEKQFRQQLV